MRLGQIHRSGSKVYVGLWTTKGAEEVAGRSGVKIAASKGAKRGPDTGWGCKHQPGTGMEYQMQCFNARHDELVTHKTQQRPWPSLAHGTGWLLTEVCGNSVAVRLVPVQRDVDGRPFSRPALVFGLNVLSVRISKRRLCILTPSGISR